MIRASSAIAASAAARATKMAGGAFTNDLLHDLHSDMAIIIPKRWQLEGAGHEKRAGTIAGTARNGRGSLFLFREKKKGRRRPTLARAGPALPSAMGRLTSVFGMGTGMTASPWPPARKGPQSGTRENHNPQGPGSCYEVRSHHRVKLEKLSRTSC